MSHALEIGRLLRASTTGCVVGCKVSQIHLPTFGEMVRIPLDSQTQVYGLIYDIHIDDDGLVRQLVTAADVPEDVILDNRQNRNVPLEISVLFTGYEEAGEINHLLPPRPPLTLDAIYRCDQDSLRRFSGMGRFGYFRHVLRAQDLPVGELLAAHLRQAAATHAQGGDPTWASRATQELITLLRDDYPTLMTVLGSLSDARIFKE
jgi:hypothetical protein